MIDPNAHAQAVEDVERLSKEVAILQRELSDHRGRATENERQLNAALDECDRLRADIAVLVRREIRLTDEIGKKTPKHEAHIYCNHCKELGASRDKYKRDYEDMAQLQRETLGSVRQRDEKIARLMAQKS